MGGDGRASSARLDPDDLDEVVGRGAPEILDDGVSSTVLGRLDDGMERLGVRGWLRRHRRTASVLTLLGTAVLVAAVWGFGTLGDRLPDPDPVLRVSVLSPEVLDPSLGDHRLYADRDMQIGVYSLVADEDDPSAYDIVGVDGPAVRASTATERPVAARIPPTFAVRAIVDCTDPSALSATREDFHLLVHRIDRYGRDLTRRVDIPADGADWSAHLRRTCLQTQVEDGLTMSAMRVEPGTQVRTATLHATVSSTLPVRLLVASDVAVPDPPPSVAVGSAVAAVPAGGAADLAVPLAVLDCARPRLAPVWIYAGWPPGLWIDAGWLQGRPVQGVAVSVTAADEARAWAVLRLSQEQTDSITAALVEACA
ncbi:hypothetical protein [Longivirga aurantiaca]|uniref:Uncharacterized protein n=1 Tax=Longivirga aurantiaca TaxID=1837743 RepID=A0ABW1SX52_9ACTN